jgi:uncharacterized protein involved in outer membrane biogenesis
MKRKLALLSTVVVVLLITGVAIIAWKAGDIVTAYRPQIEQKISESIGAEVSVGDLSVSILPQPRLSLRRLSIKGSNGESPGLSVGALHANAALLPLFSKRLELSSITVEEPVVSLVKGHDGAITVQGISPSNKPRTQEQPSQGSDPTAPLNGLASQSAGSLSVSVERIQVTNGAVRLLDATTQRALEAKRIEFDSQVRVTERLIALSDTSLSLDAPGGHPLSLTSRELSLHGDTQALKVKDTSIKTPAGILTLSANLPGANAVGQANLTSKDLSVSELTKLLNAFAPQLAQYNLTGKVSTKLTLAVANDGLREIRGPISISGVSATVPGNQKLSNLSGELLLDGKPTDLGVTLKPLSLNYNEAAISMSGVVRAKPETIAFQSLSVKAFEGSIEAPATLTRAPTPVLSAIKPNISGISLTAALKAFKPALASTISGTLSSCKGDFSAIALNNPANTAHGNGSLELTNGVLKGFNIPNQVLTNVNNLPFLSDNLRKRVPPEFEAAVSKPDMVIHQLQTTFSISGGLVNIGSLRATSDIFTIQGKGSYSMAGDLSLSSDIIFTPEFSKGVVDRVKELKPLVNGEGRLTLPVTLKGRVPAVLVLPNLPEIAKRTSVGAITNILSGALKGGKDGKSKNTPLGKILGF